MKAFVPLQFAIAAQFPSCEIGEFSQVPLRSVKPSDEVDYFSLLLVQRKLIYIKSLNLHSFTLYSWCFISIKN